MRVIAASAVGLLLAATACGDDDGDATVTSVVQTTPSHETSAVGSETTTAPSDFTWLAVYEIEPYSEERRTTFIDDADPFMFEGPASCFDGLTAELDRGEVYILAVVAVSEDELRRAQARVEGEAILIGRYGDRCNH